MPLQIISLTPDFAVSPQLATTDFAALAQQGFKTIINNRPDGEGGGAQPTSPEMERAATVAGLHYVSACGQWRHHAGTGACHAQGPDRCLQAHVGVLPFGR